ncbi:MAG: hypothetical protein JRG84_09480 [Deltaproteobacteria bacterium]|nr:hypothetical protein [Deltaproteobacteria bacterium]
MNTKKIGVIALAVAALMLVASAAGAVALRGRGQLTAAGSGLVVLDFRGQRTFAGFGLAIVEENAILRTAGEGRMRPLPDGRVLLEGFGRVTLRSPDERTRVEIAGARLRLRARGAGVAVLKGVGHFMADDVDGVWAEDRVLEFEEGDGE